MSGVIDLTSDDEVEAPPYANDEARSDEEDEDLKLAIAMSLQDQADIESVNKVSTEPVHPPQPRKEPEVSSSVRVGLLGLDRKAMEAERLARLKRKREPESSTQPKVPSRAQHANATTRISPPPPRRQNPNPTASVTAQFQSSVTKNTSPSFRIAQVLLTSDPSRRDPTNPSRYTSISFADIVRPPSDNLQLKSTLLSSFIADFDWILAHFNTRTTTFLLILHAQTSQHRALLEADFAGLPNVRLVMPEVMGGGGNMHSKVMLLFYQSRDGSSGTDTCRIVIPSANLTRADWGVGGVLENVLFVVDLPLKSDQKQEACRFETNLRMQLTAMGVPDSVLRKLDRFDFSVTQHVGFVYSRSGSDLLNMGNTKQSTVPEAKKFFQQREKVSQAVHESHNTDKEAAAEKHEVDDPARTGLLSLHDAVVSLGLKVSSDNCDDLPQVDFITSSLGNLTSQFVRQLYLAVCGKLDPAKIVAESKRSNTRQANVDNALDATIMENLKIYFPTSETVQRSKGGPGAAGTICFQSKWWDTNSLIRRCLHDCIGVRGDGILMHSKILYVRFRKPHMVRGCDGYDRRYAGWAYIGSANLSESAWGRVVSDAKLRQPKLTCRNWESGILVPVDLDNATKTQKLWDEGTDEARPHFGDENEERDTGILSKAHSDNASISDQCMTPTFVKKVAMQVKAGEREDATYWHQQTGGSGEVIASGRSTMAIAMGGTSQQEHMNTSQELPSLGKAFAEAVPVPIQHPAPSHVARQQKPWFFMG